MISITNVELDDLELRCRLLARAGNASAATKRKAADLVEHLRNLSVAIGEDLACVGCPQKLACADWEAANAIHLPKKKG